MFNCILLLLDDTNALISQSKNLKFKTLPLKNELLLLYRRHSQNITYEVLRVVPILFFETGTCTQHAIVVKNTTSTSSPIQIEIVFEDI
jgi:hypothetical protein